MVYKRSEKVDCIMTFIRKPTIVDGKWSVVIAEDVSPLSKVIETIPCTSQGAAFRTYRRMKKQKGDWL